ALRLAVVTGKGRWLDYLFRLYASQRRLMSAGLIEELYEAARKVQGTSPAHLEAYLAVLRSAPAIRSASERVLMGRLEGVLALLRWGQSGRPGILERVSPVWRFWLEHGRQHYELTAGATWLGRSEGCHILLD